MRSDTKPRSLPVLCESCPESITVTVQLIASSVPDFDMLEDGDMTEIGAKGVSLRSVLPIPRGGAALM